MLKNFLITRLILSAQNVLINFLENTKHSKNTQKSRAGIYFSTVIFFKGSYFQVTCLIIAGSVLTLTRRIKKHGIQETQKSRAGTF